MTYVWCKMMRDQLSYYFPCQYHCNSTIQKGDKFVNKVKLKVHQTEL